MNTARSKRDDLRVRSVFFAADDCACVSHALALGRSATSDETSDRLLHVRQNPLRCIDLIRAADFANHDNAIGVIIFGEEFKHIDESHSAHRIATDPNAGRLTHAEFRCLPDCFIRERAGSTDDANTLSRLRVCTMRVDVARHDADLASTFELRICATPAHASCWRNDAGAVGADECCVRERLERFLRANHVLHRYALGDRADHANACGCSFENRVSRTSGRHENHRRVRARCFDSLSHRVKDRQSVGILLPTFSRGHAADHLGSVGEARLRVRCTCAASDALTKNLSFSVDENGHWGEDGTATSRQRNAEGITRYTRRAMAKKPLTYAESGVDINAGDEVVERIKPILRRTHTPRVIGMHGAFAGMFRLDFNQQLFKRNYRDPVLVACTDGVGTKVKLAADAKIYDGVGIDCVAMNVNDLIVQGAEPLFFLDYLGLSKLCPTDTTAMIEGVARGCELAGCALIGGECAEMPDIYSPGDFDVAGFCVGVVELKRVIDPARVRKGDIIIGLAASGLHSNGYTLVRRIIKDEKLDLKKAYPGFGGKKLIDVLLEPTRIYAKPIVKLLASYKRIMAVSGMAHITGGGLPGNVSRALPSTFDARIDCTTWKPHPIFGFLQERGGIERDEMFRVFNMGIGYTLIVRPTHAKKVVAALKRSGEKPTIIGEIVKGTGEVQLDFGE